LKRRRAQTDRICAIVPANVLHLSKARLARHLDASSRSRLSTAMLMDVLCTLHKVRRIHRITVVSADFAVRGIARSMRVHFLWEGKRRGLNKGLRLAILDAKRRNFSAALILPSDIPLTRSREIGRLLRLSENYPVALTPSKDGRGTNALLLRPPGVITPVFGKNSFRRHLSLANREGLSARIVKSTGIAADVDNRSDVVILKLSSLRNETGRFLRTLDGSILSSGRQSLIGSVPRRRA